MRNLLFLPLLTLLALPLWSLAPGDDLAGYWKANTKKYTSSRIIGPLKGWEGYETAVLGTDTGFTQPPFLLVVRKVSGAVVVPLGAIQGQSTMIVDSDGDGLLDVTTNKSLVPGWAYLKVPGQRGDGKGFRALADRIYRQYNQDRGPVPAQLALLVDELKRMAIDPKDADRDLAGALQFALEEGATETAIGTGTLAALGLSLVNRGGPTPLVFLFLGEALETGGLLDEAQSAYDRILDLDPKSVIATYKKARVDPVQLAIFKKAHPDFWAARD